MHSTAALGGSQNQAWAKDKNAFGRKMLEKMGWKDGSGLGKDEQGEKTHVRIKKRGEKLALGQEGYSSTKGGGANGMANRIDAYAGQRSWMETHDNFANVLSSLSSEYSSQHEKKKRKKEKKDKKKKRDKKSVGTADTADSTKRGGEDHALGAFSFRKKNIRNKRLNGLSEKDLACLLGGVPGTSPARAQSLQSSQATHTTSVVKEEKKKKKKKKKKKEKEKEKDTEGGGGSRKRKMSPSSEDNSVNSNSSSDDEKVKSMNGLVESVVETKKKKKKENKKKKKKKKRRKD